MNIIDAEAFLHRLEGGVIDHCEVTEDGLHIVLEDGRVMIVVGQIVLGLIRPETARLQ